jgi:D-glycero-alpha-D-manno-heptose 1-phosphate guanylyltransferase
VDEASIQAVILAGGLGMRMRPLTEKTPKPMLLVRGKPFLYHQIALLKSHGLRKILLLVSYLGQEIERFFTNGCDLGVTIEYVYEPFPLGTGGALKNAEAQLDSQFVLLNGDTYLDIDYQALISSFRSCHCEGLIVAFENQTGSFAGNLALSSEGSVTGYSKKDSRGMTHVDAGVIVLDKTVLQLIPSGQRCSLEEEIYPLLIQHRQLRAWPTSEVFVDIGNVGGLQLLARKLS